MRVNIIIILLLSFITKNSYSQDNLDQLEVKLKSLHHSIELVKIDTTESVKNQFNGVSIIKSGEYKGVATVYIDSASFDLLIFTTSNDSIFKEQVNSFHMHASCTLSKDYNLFFTIYKTKNFYLFLPMNPCWTGGYSDIMKKVIEKMN
jgi:hypothetical protein